MATDHICQNENIVKNKQLIAQGAEALIYKADYFSPSSPDPNTCQKVILKIRPKKNYRIESLDKSLRRSRTRAELKALEKAKTSKINCPKLIHSDKMSTSIIMEEILGVTLKQLVNFIAIDCYGTVTGCNTDVVIPAEDESEDEQDQLVDLSKSGSDILANLLKPLVIQVADLVAKLHTSNMIHGDITTSNIMVSNLDNNQLPNPSSLNTTEKVHNFLNNLQLSFIDFGLSKTNEAKAEERAVDLYVLERAWISTHPTTANCLACLWEEYFKKLGKDGEIVMKKLSEVRLRGRKRSMLG